MTASTMSPRWPDRTEERGMAGGMALWRRPRVLIAGSLVLASLATLAAYLRYPSVLRFSSAREDTRPLGRSAMAVAPGVFLLGGLVPSGAYVIDTSAGLVLVDSGLAADAAPLKSQMTELGLD